MTAQPQTLFAEPPLAFPPPVSAWQSMRGAPTTRWILIKSTDGGRPYIYCAMYNPIHGGFCAKPSASGFEHVLQAHGWCEIPAGWDQP
jgi:hypothetical protein